MVQPGAAGDEREAVEARRAQDLGDRGGAAEVVEQARLPVDREGPVQFAPPDVAVDQQRLVARLGKRARQVGGNERLALVWSRAGDGEPHRPRAVGVRQVEPDAPERLQRLRGVGRLLNAVLPTLDGRDRPEDRQPEFAGYLVGIAEPLVELVEQDGQCKGQPKARHEAEHDDPRRRIGVRPARRDRRVENLHVGNGTGQRQLGFFIPGRKASCTARRPPAGHG